MGRKKATTLTPTHDLEYRLGAHWLAPGTEVALRGRRGARFRFQYARRTSTGKTTLTFVGGPLSGKNDQYVAVYPEAVTKVYTKNRTPININREKKGHATQQINQWTLF